MKKRGTLWAILGILLFAGCSSAPASQVIVYNNSGATVKDVSVVGPGGFFKGVKHLNNKDFVMFKVRPSTVMSFQMGCSHPDGPVSIANVGYVEPSKRVLVRMTINSDLTVSTEQTNL